MTNHINRAVSANIAAAKAQVAFIDAATKAEERFLESALAFVTASDNGASDAGIAKAVKEAAAGLDARLRPFTYTSPTSVGYHRRTGLLLSLGGEVIVKGDLVLGHQVQTAVKVAVETIKSKAVDEAIAKAETAQAAYDALVRLTKAAKDEAAEQAEQAEGEESEETETEGDLDALEQYLLLALDQMVNAERAIAGGASLSDTAKAALDTLAAKVAAFTVAA